MTAMTHSSPTHPAPRFPYRHHHPVTTAMLVVLFWILGAMLIEAAHVEIEPRSPRAAAVATIAAVLITAFAYTRLVAREAGMTHALGIGIAWLVLCITTEIVFATHAGHGWFMLLGSPDRPLVRNLLLFAWIFSPALFAARAESS